MALQLQLQSATALLHNTAKAPKAAHVWLWEELLVMVHAQDIEPDSSLGWHFVFAQLHRLAQLTYLHRNDSVLRPPRRPNKPWQTALNCMGAELMHLHREISSALSRQ